MLSFAFLTLVILSLLNELDLTFCFFVDSDCRKSANWNKIDFRAKRDDFYAD